MRVHDIPKTRLKNQQINGTVFHTPKEIVNWMGAMQAQDLQMAKWAIGIRLQGSTEYTIDNAINSGDIFRLHLLRPTWHFVSSDDIRWMLKLTGSKIKKSLSSRWKYFEIDDALLKKVYRIIKYSLRNNNHLTRDELKILFEKNNIPSIENRNSHLLAAAELDGLICSGKLKNGKPTYALLNERVPSNKEISKEESLFLLAQKYFTSHGPASVKDFSWWSGLNLTESGRAIEMINNNFESLKIGSDILLFKNLLPSEKINKSALLLPAFDEFIISYKDRTAVYNPENHTRLISSNGIFYPLILINGKVKGLWKRTIKKDKVIINTDLFLPLTKSMLNELSKAVKMYASFINKEPEIIFTS